MPRIIRQESPSGYGDNYSKTRPSLRRDFARRCAYCMVHDEMGESFFSIDHFRPQSNGGTHAYPNLYYVCMVCNRRKYFYWPSEAEVSAGIGFCDPCAEWDYGEHIFEEDNNSLVTRSAKGEYHLGKIDLNRKELVENRARRDFLLEMAAEIESVINSSDASAQTASLHRRLVQLQKIIAQCIPRLPLRGSVSSPSPTLDEGATT